MENLPVVVGTTGDGHDVTVTAILSRKSALTKIKETGAFAEHVALSTKEGYKWSDMGRLGIRATDLLKIWEVNRKKALQGLFPELSVAEIDELEDRMLVNTPGAAQRDDVHAHVLVAPRSVWKSGIIPRIVDPFEPIQGN